MSIDAVKALRDKVKLNAALSDFFFQHYNKDAKHFVGYKKSNNAADFPCISYVVPQSTIGDPSGERLVVSVVIGVNDGGITDDVFDGVENVNAAARLFLKAFEIGLVDLKTVWLGEARIIGDMGARHPFYEIEIILPLLWRG